MEKNDKLSYLKKEYHNLELVLKRNHLDKITPNIKISSSGGSHILIYPKHLIKLYLKQNKNLFKNTIRTYNDLGKKCNLPKLYDWSEYILVQERLVTYNDNFIDLTNYIDIKKMLLDIGYLLRCFHSNSYYHGDVSLYNMGFSLLTNKYLLYDFDTSKDNGDPKLYYTDIEQLLDSIKFNVKGKIRDDIINLKKEYTLYTRYISGTHTVKIMGRKREYPKLSYNYEPDLFVGIVMSLQDGGYYDKYRYLKKKYKYLKNYY